MTFFIPFVTRNCSGSITLFMHGSYFDCQVLNGTGDFLNLQFKISVLNILIESWVDLFSDEPLNDSTFFHRHDFDKITLKPDCVLF